MEANFTPKVVGGKEIGSFRFWVQKVLPLVYDDSLSYYELLCKVVAYINELIKNGDRTNENIVNLVNAYEQLQNYVNNYFNSLDVSTQINNYMDGLVESGELDSILENIFGGNEVVLISDSYGDPTASGGTSWQQFVESYLSTRVVHKYYKGGCGFGWANTSAYYFPTFISTIPSNDKVKDVLILCGANDGNLIKDGTATASSIEGGIAETANILRNKFPNAKISLGFVGRYKLNDRDMAYYDACEIYKRCTKYNICFAGGFQYVLHNRALIDDGDVHPNEDGSNRIAQYAVNYLSGGCVNVTDFYYALPGQNSMFINVNVNNATTNLHIHCSNTLQSGVGYAVTVNKTLTLGNVITIGTVSVGQNFMPSGALGAIGSSGTVYASYDDNSGGSLCGYFYMVGNTLYFQLVDVPPTSVLCKAVYFYGVDIACPTMFC